MDWKSLVKGIAPVIGSFIPIGGPVAAWGIGALADALWPGEDNKDKTEEMVASALQQMTPEQAAAIKKADQDFKVRMDELGLKREELAYQDTASARAMQIETRDWIPRALSVLTVAGWVFLVWVCINKPTWAEGSKDLLYAILATANSALMLVLSFYFGSSQGSQSKDALLYKSKPAE